MRKQITISSLTILLILSFAAPVLCSQTITVPLGEPTTTNISLNQGDYISGSIVVTGGLNSNINFYITDPDSNNVASYSQVIQTSFSFTAQTTGTYTLHFQNLGLLSRNVTVDYNIKSSVIGLPQDTFIILVVAIILTIIIVISIIILAIRRSKATQSTA